MPTAAHLYEIFIKAPRQRVWDALTAEGDTTRYFHGTRFESTFEPGAPFVNRIVAADRPAADGTIEVFDPPNRLVYTWHVLYDDEMAAEPAGRVEWTLADANDEGTVTRVMLRHGDLALSPKTWLNVKLGWVGILDNLKTLLETGEPMGDVDTGAPADDDVEGDWHRAQGIAAHNSAFELMDGRTLSRDEADELLARVYAASYHWARAARRTPINAARAAYMIARAHATLGQGAVALAWVDRYAELLSSAGDEAADFDLAYVHEGRARALASAGRLDEAAKERELAATHPIADPDDKAIVDDDLRTEPWYGLV
jgi:uncharacterized protein YndB with AHSA1/START domain